MASLPSGFDKSKHRNSPAGANEALSRVALPPAPSWLTAGCHPPSARSMNNTIRMW